ncbi:hypothetical protein ACLKA6_002777 [Drosophila palustris]
MRFKVWYVDDNKNTTVSYSYFVQRLGTEAPIRLTQCPAVDDPNHVVMLPYPNNCRKYYTCLHGLGYAHQCPDNYFWSQITYRCDVKELSNCIDPIEPLSPIQQPSQYSAYPGDCRRYYKTQILSCQGNEHWNAQTQRCDLPQFAGCLAPTSPVIIPSWTPNNTSIITPLAPTPPTITPTPVTPNYTPNYLPIDPELICKNSVGMQYVQYPGDCHKFIYCPTATVLYCPGDLYWNSIKQSCDTSCQ